MMMTQQQPLAAVKRNPALIWKRRLWLLRKSPLTLIGGGIMVLVLLLMIFSPWLVPHDPNAIDLAARLQAPSLAHWFGTDEGGRDLFSRVLIGSKQSVAAGLAVVLIAGISGSLLGCLSGVLGGRIDIKTRLGLGTTVRIVIPRTAPRGDGGKKPLAATAPG